MLVRLFRSKRGPTRAQLQPTYVEVGGIAESGAAWQKYLRPKFEDSAESDESIGEFGG
jgi:hypothetical protein